MIGRQAGPLLLGFSLPTPNRFLCSTIFGRACPCKRKQVAFRLLRQKARPCIILLMGITLFVLFKPNFGRECINKTSSTDEDKLTKKSHVAHLSALNFVSLAIFAEFS